MGRKINSYVVSEFTERLCAFRDTSLTRTKELKIEATMLDLFVFVRYLGMWFVVRGIGLVGTLVCLPLFKIIRGT